MMMELSSASVSEGPSGSAFRNMSIVKLAVQTQASTKTAPAPTSIHCRSLALGSHRVVSSPFIWSPGESGIINRGFRVFKAQAASFLASACWERSKKHSEQNRRSLSATRLA